MKDNNIYIVAYYFKKPKAHVNTSVKGWMDNPDNVRWDEKVGITRGISKKDIQAHVIVNLSEKRVEKNSLNGNKDFEQIFKYFFAGYSKYITEVMSKLDPAYLEHMVNVWEADLQSSADESNVVDIPAQVVSETVSS